jgi:hypothetical protein
MGKNLRVLDDPSNCGDSIRSATVRWVDCALPAYPGGDPDKDDE